MASLISHAVAGAAFSIAFAPEGAPARYWPVAIVAAVLPDVDSLRLATADFFTLRFWK